MSGTRPDQLALQVMGSAADGATPPAATVRMSPTSSTNSRRPAWTPRIWLVRASGVTLPLPRFKFASSPYEGETRTEPPSDDVRKGPCPTAEMPSDSEAPVDQS